MQQILEAGIVAEGVVVWLDFQIDYVAVVGMGLLQKRDDRVVLIVPR